MDTGESNAAEMRTAPPANSCPVNSKGILDDKSINMKECITNEGMGFVELLSYLK